jgi:hypothetical protein
MLKLVLTPVGMLGDTVADKHGPYAKQHVFFEPWHYFHLPFTGGSFPAPLFSLMQLFINDILSEAYPGSFLEGGEQNIQNIKLTTHLYLVLISRMVELYSTPPHTTSWLGAQLHFL